MRFADLVSMVVGGLRRRKLRFLLTVVGVVIGSAAVVLMMALGAGMQRSMVGQFTTGTATQIRVMPAGSMDPGPQEAGSMDDEARTEPRQLDEEAAEELAKLPRVASVRPRLMVPSERISFKKYEMYGPVYGVPLTDMRNWGVEMESGRMPTASSECVVGAQVPMALLSGMDGGPMATGSGPRVDLLDKRLAIAYTPMEADPDAEDGTDSEATVEDVVLDEETGVVEPKEKRFKVVGIMKATDYETDISVFIPEDEALEMSGVKSKDMNYETVLVNAEKPGDVETLRESIMEMGFDAWSQQQEVEQARQGFLIVEVVLGGLGGIALLVASIGITNTMTMSIYERTREIGIMKAVGASGKHISRIFLAEAGIIGMAGGLLGLVLSWAVSGLANLALAQALAGQMGNPFAAGGGLFYIPLWLAFFAVGFATLIGLVAGILPAMRASNLNPLVALRHE